ncbi:ubiquitin carboxyl-terminal hydrolase 20-like [Ptychodera flava]|uniref:ubiquitin carboxyl-terminal hydrolase 20-like n=1 Tax=Ptychodera flava TaxID=63121 RepID=UPI003969E8EA
MNGHSNCPHVNTLGDFIQQELKQKAEGNCDSCDARGPNLWACLQAECGYVGCGESAVDHSTDHTKKTFHALTVNLTTMRVWCYDCEAEVFLQNNDPDVKMVLEQRRQASKRVPSPRPHSLPERYEEPQQLGDDDSDQDDDDDDDMKPRGLTGLKNIGNTCYLNSALQALSNCPPLMQFFFDCGGFVRTDMKPTLCKSYQKLTAEMWDKKRPSYVVPSTLVHSMKLVYPMFRGFAQQDTQEFLRCLMDRMHEELKQPLPISQGEDNEKQIHVQTLESSRRQRSRDSASLSEEETRSHDAKAVISASDVHLCDDCTSDTGCSRANSATTRKPNKKNKNKKNKNQDKDADGEEAGDTVQCEKCGCEMKRIEDGSGDKCNDVNASVRSSTLTSEVNDTTDNVDNKSLKVVEEKRQCSPVRDGVVNRSDKAKNKKKKQSVQYRSIISDVFDGKILSSVQCLTCDTVSSTKETFQDLSLPIPGKDDLARIHAVQNAPLKLGSCTDAYNSQGWFSWMFDWFKGWFWGPHVTLEDCLAAFFAADDLKGDNMYSCEKCKKLRNGVKMSQMLELPEILCVHLKRFRHEMMYSSKISSYVQFPLEGLDVKPFLSQESPSKCTMYDLVSVICHHGTAGGGHYTAYCQNWINGQWYEFDDVYVTEVHDSQVANAEAYVLFYRKNSPEALKERQKVVGMTHNHEPSLLQFFVSKQWLNKFNTFAEPGPITNSDFLCMHGGVPPSKAKYVDELVTPLPQPVWEYLYNRFGGGPAVNHLYVCPTCQVEMEKLEKRRKDELETFIELNTQFQHGEDTNVIYFLSMSWFKQWEGFVKAKQHEPPGPIDNRDIAVNKGGQWFRKNDADYGQISEDMWNFFHSIYGGEPELLQRQNKAPSPTPSEPDSESDEAQDREEEDAEVEEMTERIEKGQIDEQEKE